MICSPDRHMNEHQIDIIALVLRTNDFDVSKYEISFLELSLQKRMNETGCDSAGDYCALLEADKGEQATFINSLKISYSLFFRNPLTCAVLERIVLPALVLKKEASRSRELRIWSAACAGGEEAYSLAMLLEELVAGNENVTYRIFATDQSDVQVEKARAGEYAAAALNNLSMRRAGEWFVRRGDAYTVNPELQKHIEFSTFDLFRDGNSCPAGSIFGDFDLVICANLFFYYTVQYRDMIFRKIDHCLTAGGYLVTGGSERDIVMRHRYQELYPQSAVFKRVSE